MLARRVWCTKADYHRVVFVELEDTAGKKAIYAAGNSEYGCLGLHEKDGQKIKESQTFAKLELDSQDTHFVDIACYRNGILAVDERGKLWGWGKNENYQLGIPDNTHSEGIFKPTELGAINKTVMDRKQMEIGGITLGNEASGAGTTDADLGAINKPVMDRMHMEV